MIWPASPWRVKTRYAGLRQKRPSPSADTPRVHSRRGPTPRPSLHAGAVHTLTRDEGLAVLGRRSISATIAAPNRIVPISSTYFTSAPGFPYAYAPSIELYSGIDQFQRGNHPQAGDLAVWRGHAGIVVNPVQHSFFSLLRSGAGVESYDSPVLETPRTSAVLPLCQRESRYRACDFVAQRKP